MLLTNTDTLMTAKSSRNFPSPFLSIALIDRIYRSFFSRSNDRNVESAPEVEFIENFVSSSPEIMVKFILAFKLTSKSVTWN